MFVNIFKEFWHNSCNMKVFLCLLCVFVSLCVGEECANKKGDDEITISSSTSCSIEFQITKGYQMEAEFTELQLDSSDGTNVLLKTEHNEKDYKFVWEFKDPKKFIIDQSKMSLIFDTKNTKSRFSIHLKRHGPLTTTQLITTEIPWPEPISNDSIYHTVNISVTTKQFTKHEMDFKLLLVNMTESYCSQQKILLAENVTIKNINIQLALQCPLTWPEYTQCTQVRYAIPVFLQDSEKYELTSKHLARMWEELAAGIFKDELGWDLYEEPNNSYSLLIWLVVCLGILVAFLVVLFFARNFSYRFGGRIKRRDSDSKQIIGTPSRVSDASLWPTSSQIIPPLFDAQAESGYVFYEPDASVKPSLHQQGQVNSSHRLNVDESSDEEILNIANNSASVSYSPNIIQLDHSPYNKESAL